MAPDLVPAVWFGRAMPLSFPRIFHVSTFLKRILCYIV
ncbi:hypothetical protein VD0001_g6376 [Verticillium dahliae]|nr:hypothetical protein VD0001_g6376 [Verticillium dahliae]